MVFFLKRVHERLDWMDQKLANSFVRIKQDNENLYAWVRYLNEQTELQRQEILRKSEVIGAHASQIAMQQRLVRELREELNVIPRTKEELRQVIDEVYSFELLLARLKNVEDRIQVLEVKRSPSPVQRPVLESVKPHISSLKERVLKRIARNSKEYIKSVITGIIRKYGKMSALALRDMVVEEQGLCSKSSFYRVLEELESEMVMRLVSKGKEKVYLAATK